MFLFFIFFLFYILYNSILSREGFSFSQACNDALSQYAFLGIPKDSPMVDISVNGVSNKFNYWSQEAFDGVNKQGKLQGWICNADGTQSIPGTKCSPPFTPETSGSIYQMIAVDEEAIYFGNNGVWPYGSYIKDYLNTMGGGSDNFNNSGENALNYFNKHLPTRFAYAMSGLYNSDSQKDPLPDSYKIFLGQMDPPPNYDTNTLSGIECKIGKVF